MRSKASIKGHPIHPMLVTFPIAFFIGGFLSDIALFITHAQQYDLIARYLIPAGIFSALLAAVPGLIDYYYTVPPESSAHKRATKHGLLNVLMVMIFSTAVLLRINSDTSLIYILLLETTGLILLSISGWLGGTLVMRNQIGVDHRYAHAGKWKHEIINTKEKIIELENLHELKVNQMKLLQVNSQRIVIARTENGIVAFEDHCTHRGGSLADGTLICETVQCPWHGSQFDVNTGNMKAGPAKKKIKVYSVSLENKKNLLHL